MITYRKIERLAVKWDGDADPSLVVGKLLKAGPEDAAAFCAELCRAYTPETAVEEIAKLAKLMRQKAWEP